MAVVDLSGPSVPQELALTVPHQKMPFVPILERGRRDWSLARDMLDYPWVLGPSLEFSSIPELLEQLGAKIAKAEAWIEARRARLKSTL